MNYVLYAIRILYCYNYFCPPRGPSATVGHDREGPEAGSPSAPPLRVARPTPCRANNTALDKHLHVVILDRFGV